MSAGDGFFQEAQVACQGKGTILDGDLFAIDLFDAVEQEHAGGIASGGQEARFDGGTAVVLRRHKDDGALEAGGATGQGAAAAEAGGDVQGEQGGAGAGFAFEQGEGAQGEVVLPEPGDGLFGDIGEQEARGGRLEWGAQAQDGSTCR